ncbi:MAG: RNA polymerase sigma factor [Bryobacterales bacterium]|nr:RNA polymerase sigma factor [Bryobacterales bacterium]
MSAEIEEQPGLTDAELLASAAEGSRQPFHQLVARHQAALWRHARALTNSREDAEEVLQETLLSAWKSAGTYRGEANVKTWLFTIARHAAFRLGRKASAEPELVDIDTLGDMAGWGVDHAASRDPESLAILAQDRKRMSAALNALGPEDREILILRELEGLSGEDTARILGISLVAMKSRLHRARLRLAIALRGGAS